MLRKKLSPLRALFVVAAAHFGLAGCASQKDLIRGSENVIAATGLDRQFYQTTWNNYLAERGSEAELDQTINKCRQDPDSCHTLMQRWVRIIDTVNLLPKDAKRERALLVDYIFNQGMAGSKMKCTSDKISLEGHDGQRIQAVKH